jgi:hypothetical protein
MDYFARAASAPFVAFDKPSVYENRSRLLRAKRCPRRLIAVHPWLPAVRRNSSCRYTEEASGAYWSPMLRLGFRWSRS